MGNEFCFFFLLPSFSFPFSFSTQHPNPLFPELELLDFPAGRLGVVVVYPEEDVFRNFVCGKKKSR